MPHARTPSAISRQRPRNRFRPASFRIKHPLPPGDLFYPCSGPDLFSPLRTFVLDGRTLHGADLDRPPLTDFTDPNGLDAEMLETSAHSFTLEGPFTDRVSIHNLRNGEGWNPPSNGVRERYSVRTRDGSPESWTVVRHRYDAIEAFKLLPSLAMFFAIGDRSFTGEGSSGISWLGNALFPRVLAKIAPGGLLVTDGLGLERRLKGPAEGEPGEIEKIDDESAAAEQNPLWVRSPSGWPIAYSFTAFGRPLRLVAGVGSFLGDRTQWIWRCGEVAAEHSCLGDVQ
jgi:hypothetical protein